MEILKPKELDIHAGDALLTWARDQMAIARSILDNPGGGLLFATQTIGQVKSGLRERDSMRWESTVALLDHAEDAAIRRDFDQARALLDQAAGTLTRLSG